MEYTLGFSEGDLEVAKQCKKIKALNSDRLLVIVELAIHTHTHTHYFFNFPN